MILPTGWVRAKFADIVTHRSGNGQLIKGRLESQSADGLFPAFSASGQDVWRDRFDNEGDAIVVSAVGARCGKAFRATGRWSAIANTHIVRPEPTVIDTDYLFLILNDEGFWEKGGTAQPFVKTRATFERDFSVPPLAEQRRIVAKLNVLTTSIARTRGELDRVPALAARLRASALRNTFDVQAAQDTLSQLSEFVTSGSRGWAKYYSSAGAAFIRVGDVRRGHIGLDLTELQRVEPPAGAEGVRTALLPGDVVVTITADLGRVGLVPEGLGPAFVNQHVALVRISDTGLSEWIAWYLTSAEGQRQMLAKDRGVTKAGLGLDDIRNVTVPIPASSERQARIKVLEATIARADRLEAEAACARALLDRLESALLAKAFRGELVPQDPEDEPAGELLERIRARRAAAPKAKRGRRARATADA